MPGDFCTVVYIYIIYGVRQWILWIYLKSQTALWTLQEFRSMINMTSRCMTADNRKWNFINLSHRDNRLCKYLKLFFFFELMGVRTWQRKILSFLSSFYTHTDRYKSFCLKLCFAKLKFLCCVSNLLNIIELCFLKRKSSTEKRNVSRHVPVHVHCFIDPN